MFLKTDLNSFDLRFLSSVTLFAKCIAQHPKYYKQTVIKYGSSQLLPSKTTSNFEVVIDGQPAFTDHYVVVSVPCRLDLYSI